MPDENPGAVVPDEDSAILIGVVRQRLTEKVASVSRISPCPEPLTISNIMQGKFDPGQVVDGFTADWGVALANATF